MWCSVKSCLTCKKFMLGYWLKYLFLFFVQVNCGWTWMVIYLLFVWTFCIVFLFDAVIFWPYSLTYCTSQNLSKWLNGKVEIFLNAGHLLHRFFLLASFEELTHCLAALCTFLPQRLEPKNDFFFFSIINLEYFSSEIQLLLSWSRIQISYNS